MAKKLYIKKHGDINGFKIVSKSARAPLAELKMTVTAEGLQAQLDQLLAAKVSKASVDYVLFSKSGKAESNGKPWTLFNLYPKREREEQDDQVITING